MATPSMEMVQTATINKSSGKRMHDWEQESGLERRGKLRKAISDLVTRHSTQSAELLQSRLARIASGLPHYDGGQKMVSKDYNRVAEQLVDDLQADAPISPRRARDGAWCLWETKPAIGHISPLLENYLEQVLALADKRVSRSLCNAYLVQFRQDRPGLTQVSKALERLSFGADEPYAGLQSSLQLFSLPQGPQMLGQRALEQRRPPIALLQTLGLSNAHLLQGGFVEPCAHVALERISSDQSLKPQERLTFVRALAIDAKTGGLFFPKHKAAVANALLLPYDTGNPEPEVQSETLALVVTAIGDPRSRAEEWRSMEEAARIARRWLTKESISQFLDVVDAVALDRMWRFRRKFWNAVFDTKGQDGQSIVQEAWVVFDDVGHAQAKRMGMKELSVGRFERRSGVQKGQSVLLLRIGRMVIAEWSHNGKVRIWHNGEQEGAPKLYRRLYSSGELKDGLRGYYCDWDRSHMSPETCSWQDAVAEKLRNLTGTRISRSKYQ